MSFLKGGVAGGQEGGLAGGLFPRISSLSHESTGHIQGGFGQT